MKISSILAFLVVLIPFSPQAQSWKWANSIGSANYSTSISRIRPFNGTEAIVCGAFAAPELELGNHSFFNAGQEDGFVALLDNEGQYSWAGTLGSQGRDFIVDVAAAPGGALIAGGTFTSISLPVGNTTLLNTGETDAFLVKYNPDKTIAWAKAIGSPNLDEISGVATDNSGNIYVAGQITDKFSLQTNIIFLNKYSPSGTLLWEKQGFSQNDFDTPQLTVDDQQNVYWSSWIWGVASFDQTAIINNESGTTFVLKYTTSGILSDTCTHPEWGRINSMQAKEDLLYVCAENVNYCIGWGWPLSNSKIEVMKMDADLQPVWNKTAGGLSPCQSLDIAKSIGVDEAGNVYVAGTFFSDTLGFAGQVLPNLFEINYFYPQVFVLKYGPEGQELWGKSLGGAHADEGTAIYVASDDLFYLGGALESKVVPFDAHILQNNGTLDSMYVHLRPARYVRSPMGFVALYDGQWSNTRPEPHSIAAAIWPNPTNEYLTVTLQSPAPSPVTLSISTIDGRIIQQTSYEAGVSELYVQLNTCLPGVYCVSLVSQYGISTPKLLFIY